MISVHFIIQTRNYEQSDKTDKAAFTISEDYPVYEKEVE